MAPPPPAISIVLSSLDLWRSVTAFQGGIYADMKPLAKLTGLPKHHSSNERHVREWVTSLDAALAPWYATYGTSRIVRLVECIPRTRDLMIVHAVYFNALDRLQLLHDNFPLRRCKLNLLNLASARGHLNVVEYLHSIGHAGCDSAAMNLAARFGHLEIVQFLHTHRTEGCTTRATDMAASEGHLNVVRWLHLHRTEGCTTYAMDDASAGGYLDVVQWLHQHRREGCTRRAMDGAAANGHMDVVQWLHANRTEGCSPQLALAEALRGNHLDVAIFLAKANEVKLTLQLGNLVKRGDIATLEYIEARVGSQLLGLTDQHIHAAIWSGQLAMLQWLLHHDDVPRPPSLIRVAAMAGRLPIAQYLFPMADPMERDEAHRIAFHANKRKVADWLATQLHDQNLPTTPAGHFCHVLAEIRLAKTKST